MKINEILTEYNQASIRNMDDVLDRIENECSEFLNESNNIPLYRGIRNSSKPFIYGESSNNEAFEHSGVEWEILIDKKLKEMGFTALRSNSIYTTSDAQSASGYGPIYQVFPCDGYQFTWSSKIADLFTTFKVSEKSWEYYSSHVVPNDKTSELYVDLHELSAGEFITKYGYSTLNLEDALNSENEICIAGKYYALRADIAKKYL
jgi:hypothetical protein